MPRSDLSSTMVVLPRRMEASDKARGHVSHRYVQQNNSGLPSPDVVAVLAKVYGFKRTVDMLQKHIEGHFQPELAHHPHPFHVDMSPAANNMTSFASQQQPLYYLDKLTSESDRDQSFSPPMIPTVIDEDPFSGPDGADRAMATRRRRCSGSGKQMQCQVCGDLAPNHIHYGGIACFSCRAFFRRSVPKHLAYYCGAEDKCEVTPTTRKNCQKCRYRRCIEAGMKTTWVLSEEERIERINKKNGNRCKREAAAEGGSQQQHRSKKMSWSDSASWSSGQSPRPSSSSSAQSFRLTASEEQNIGDWMCALESSRAEVPLPVDVSSALERTAATSSTLTEQDPGAVHKMFEVVYRRAVAFANRIPAFRALAGSDQVALLKRNLDAMASVRMAAAFYPEDKLSVSDLSPEAGAPTPQPLHVDQMIAEPWTNNPEYTLLYSRTMLRLSLLSAASDARTALLLQLVALFNAEDAASADLEGREAVERAQHEAAATLHAHLRCKYASEAQAAAIFGNLVQVLHDLRAMTQMLLEQKE